MFSIVNLTEWKAINSPQIRLSEQIHTHSSIPNVMFVKALINPGIDLPLITLPTHTLDMQTDWQISWVA